MKYKLVYKLTLTLPIVVHEIYYVSENFTKLLRFAILVSLFLDVYFEN